MVKKLSIRQVLVLHQIMLNKYGGMEGIRDLAGLESALNRPFATYNEEDLYSGLLNKAAAMIQSLVGNHPFADANKRTAWSAAYIYLKLNGLEVSVSQKELVDFMVRVASQHISVEDIRDWLGKHLV